MSIYALISCGYVLIYRTSRVLNLAHGELMMLGAYGLFATASLFGAHPLLVFRRINPLCFFRRFIFRPLLLNFIYRLKVRRDFFRCFNWRRLVFGRNFEPVR